MAQAPNCANCGQQCKDAKLACSNASSSCDWARMQCEEAAQLCEEAAMETASCCDDFPYVFCPACVGAGTAKCGPASNRCADASEDCEKDRETCATQSDRCVECTNACEPEEDPSECGCIMCWNQPDGTVVCLPHPCDHYHPGGSPHVHGECALEKTT